MFKNETDLEKIVDRLNIDAAPNPEHSENLRRQMLSIFDKTGEQHISQSRRLWRTILKSPILKLAAAAILLIALVIGTYRLAGPIKMTGTAFADIVRPILTAQTATCKITIDADRDQLSETLECMFAEPGRMRQELPGKYISIIDLRQGKLVILMLEEKKAMVMEMESIPDEYKDKSQTNMFLEVRRQIQQAQQSEDTSVEFLGEQEIDGRTAIGYHIEEPFFETTIWADAKTLLPIRIKTSMPTVMNQQITAVFTDFTFDIELDDSLFSLEVPEGYAVETMQWDASRPQEEDLIKMLRLWAETTDGKFPSALNMNTIYEFSELWVKERTVEFDKQREALDKQREAFDKQQERSQHLFEEYNKLSERLDEIQLPQEQLFQEYKKSSEMKEKQRILKQLIEENKKSSKQSDELNQQLEQVMQQMKEESQKELRHTETKLWQAEDFLKEGLSEQIQEAQNRMMPIMRGITFVQELPDESDWHYTGKEAAFGDTDALIFWYKPQGSLTYRVIYGDLSVKDVPPEKLPH